jgi:hypothetical protein
MKKVLVIILKSNFNKLFINKTQKFFKFNILYIFIILNVFIMYYLISNDNLFI